MARAGRALPQHAHGQGHARTYGFDALARVAHDAEETYDFCRNNEPASWDMAKIAPISILFEIAFAVIDTSTNAISSRLPYEPPDYGRGQRTLVSDP